MNHHIHLVSASSVKKPPMSPPKTKPDGARAPMIEKTIARAREEPYVLASIPIALGTAISRIVGDTYMTQRRRCLL